MSTEASRPAEAEQSRRRRRHLQWVLRGGLLAGGTLTAVGFVLALVLGHLEAVPVRPHTLLTDGVLADRLIAGGLLLLGLTPVAGVLMLIVTWARERDWRFLALGIFVSVVLLFALLRGA